MEKHRFFITNISSNTTERDLQQLFQDYGQVDRVELKKKENAGDEGVKIIAFVTLQIHEGDIKYCLNELNWQKLNGAKIKVSIAKESFLERLKREREEAAAETTVSATPATNELATDSTLLSNHVNTRKTFIEGAVDDIDIPEDLFITKKRAAGSLHNGKIFIQSFDTEPIHVIEKKPQKPTTNNTSVSELKRKQSVKLKTNQYKQNKSAIQHALAGETSRSKKIKFSDSEEDEDGATSSKTKTNIFESDDEENDDNFKLGNEHFGEKGEALVKLQSKQSLDPRFRMDVKFVDDAEDEKTKNSNKKNINAQNDDQTERNWQMGILEQVVGRKLDTFNEAEKMAKKKKMVRYDPTREEDQKLLRKNDETEKEETKKQNKKKNKNFVEDENQDITDTMPSVSKDVFYVVNDNLAESLKAPSEGFSLLSMFGKAKELAAEAAELKGISKEKILLNKATKNNSINNFHYDSSSEDSDVDESAPVGESNNVKVNGHVDGKKKKKAKISVESFFILKNDARLKEGATFFRSAPKENPNENYDEIRNRMKLLIKTKIRKISKTKNKFKNNRH